MPNNTARAVIEMTGHRPNHIYIHIQADSFDIVLKQSVYTIHIEKNSVSEMDFILGHNFCALQAFEVEGALGRI